MINIKNKVKLFLSFYFASHTIIAFSQGENCTQPIILSGLTGTYSFNTSAMVNDYTSTPCGSAYGNDIVFEFLDSIPNNYTIKLNLQTAFSHYFYARYNGCTTGTNIGCTSDTILHWTNTTGAKVKLFVIVVGTTSTQNGSGTLTWKIVPIPGQMCSQAIDLTGTTGSVNYTLNNDYTNEISGITNCSYSGAGHDIVYHFVEQLPPNYTIHMNISSNYTSYDLFYLMEGSCGSSSVLVCTTDTMLHWTNSGNIPLELWFAVDMTGHFNNTMSGTFTWKIDSIPGQMCSQAIDLSGTTGSMNYTLNNDYTDEINGITNCTYSGAGHDIVYHFVEQLPPNYTIHMNISSNYTSYDLFYLMGGSCGSSSVLVCTTDTMLHWTNSGNTPLELWFAVDMTGHFSNIMSGTFTWIIDSIPGQNCANAITLNQYIDSVQFSSYLHTNDMNSPTGCAWGGPGHDIVYYFPNVSAGYNLHIQLSANLSSLIYGYYGSCSTGTSIGCSTSGTLTWTNTTGSNQQVWFVIDRNIHENLILAGTMYYEICNNPPTAGFTYTVNGNTVDFANSTSGALSYFWDFDDGNTSTQANPQHIYSASGTYNVCLIATSYCGSDTICQTVTTSGCVNTDSTINPVACDSYTSPSGNYIWTNSGTYTDTILNSAGCDSIITINLTIKNSTNSTISPVVCDSYTSPSGNYTWTNSGTYTDIIPNSVGCDSVITINLTINTVDTSITANPPTLTANDSDATYQWVDCNNGYSAIAGATNQSYTATSNGSYAVIITQNGCTDTSSCYTVANVSIVENTFNNSISIYPNPVNEYLTITVTKKYKVLDITVINSIGQKILEKSFKTNKIKIPFKVEKGLYLIIIKNSKGEQVMYKILKE